MHINDAELDDVLFRVVRLIYVVVRRDLDEFPNDAYKYLLAVASVCRNWRRRMIPMLYKTALVECTSEKGVVTTNIEAIIASQLNSATSELIVHFEDVAMGYSRVVEIMSSAGFDAADWPRIKKLTFVDNYWLPFSHEAGSIVDPNEGMQPMPDYFAQTMPNITALKYTQYYRRGFVPVFPYNALLNSYMPQLQEMYIEQDWAPIVEAVSFPPCLTHLDISLDFGVSRHLPKLLAPSLRSLHLRDVPIYFSWEPFCSGREEKAAFSSLESCRIVFRFGPNERCLPRDHAADELWAKLFQRNIKNRLSFPVLRDLSIKDYPYKDTKFYSLFYDSPLRSVDLSGYHDAYAYVEPQLIAKASRLDVMVWTEHNYWDDTASIDEEIVEDYQEFFQRFMEWPSNAWLAVLQSGENAPISVPHQIGWTNLRHLELGLTVYLSSVLRLVVQLSLLRSLTVDNIVTDFDAVPSGEKADSGSTGSEGAPLVNKNLETLVLGLDHTNESVLNVLKGLGLILPRTPALLRLNISEKFAKEIQQYAADPQNGVAWILDLLDV
ncbi:hypothetical protein GQ54DRAFT_299075 [Martensiomyces pterosporus]|nr:hypothetical protein GQ54DRAFT_299075 [Martensiomyces pterosporus]